MDSGHVAHRFSSCRDNTIKQTAPMHTTRSPHTVGPVCGGACRGRDCSGLLGQALWVCEHVLWQPLCLYRQGPAADGFALHLEVPVTDGQ